VENEDESLAVADSLLTDLGGEFCFVSAGEVSTREPESMDTRIERGITMHGVNFEYEKHIMKLEDLKPFL
jgi:hypothetical protein